MNTLEIDGPAQVTEKLLVEIGPMHEKAVELCEKAYTVNVTDEDDLKNMKLARESRLALRKLRTSSVNRCKEIKSDALAECQAIDQTRRIIEELFQPAEKHLLDQETYAERKRQERAEARRNEREKLIIEAGEVVEDHRGFDELPDSDFQELIREIKNKIAKQKSEEEERKRKDEEQRLKEEAEAKRIREDNARLRAEAEERNRKQAEERRLQEKKLEAERQARLKAEEENRKAREAAEAEARAKARAEEIRRNAPIAEKLKLLFIDPDMEGIPTTIQFKINHAVDKYNTAIQNIINNL